MRNRIDRLEKGISLIPRESETAALFTIDPLRRKNAMNAQRDRGRTQAGTGTVNPFYAGPALAAVTHVRTSRRWVRRVKMFSPVGNRQESTAKEEREGITNKSSFPTMVNSTDRQTDLVRVRSAALASLSLFLAHFVAAA